MRPVLVRLALLLGALSLSLAAAELALRVLAPRYRYAADADHVSDLDRIWAPRPSSARVRARPDTGELHLVIRNNLGGRQHRDLEPAKPPGVTRIGFFGDSFTDNQRVAAPYSFSEVTDYLLREHGGDYEVLNFGVDGYGTDQSYITWRGSEAARGLDVVAYVFCSNDLRDLYANDLFELADDGSLRQKGAREPSAWRAALGRLYLTYLVMDAFERLAPADDLLPEPAAARAERRERRGRRLQDPVARSLLRRMRRGVESEQAATYAALFRRLLAEWRRGVEAQGARFLTVVAPCRTGGDYLSLLDGFETLDLVQTFDAYDFEGRRWRFASDGHWDELGNELAAVQITRRLEGLLGLAPLAGPALRRALYTYYRAFEADQGYSAEILVEETATTPERLQAIRERYVPLEKRYAALLARAREGRPGGSPEAE